MSKLTIDWLTPDQLDLVHIVRQEYIDAITREFDDNDIVEKVKCIYSMYGLREPRISILDLPGEIGDASFKDYIPNDNIDNSIVDKMLFDAWKQLKESVDESLIDFVKKELTNKLYGMYEENVRFEDIISRIFCRFCLEIERKHRVPVLAMYDYFLRIGAINNKYDGQNKNNNENNIEKF